MSTTTAQNLPLITVIVLTYNSAEYVLSTLESIRQQDYRGELELIIGDDCSGDDTVAACRNWIKNNSGRFTRAEILRPEENQGVVENLNACIKASRGEWIKVIAGDDILASYALRLFHETAAAAPGERLFLYSALTVFHHDEDLQEPWRLKLLPGGPGDQDLDLNYIYLKPNFWTNAPSFFFAKKLIEQIGYVPRLFRNVEDRPLFTKVLASGFRIYHISKPTVYYRVHGTSLTSAMAGARFAECNWKTYCEILRPCFAGIARLDMDLRMLPQWYILKQGGKNRKASAFKLVCRIIWALYRCFTFPFRYSAGNTLNKSKHEIMPLPPVPCDPEHQPLVSVLVPVYNSGKLLHPCLKSLAQQSYQNIEFICIDDGSTDTSAATLDAWAVADKRFKVIHQANGGYGKAMNEGLKAASGSYIGIVEPDDWVEPDMFQRLMELAQKHGADIVKANYIGERINKSRKVEKIAEHLEGSCLSPVELPDYLEGAPSIWSAIYRREWLHEHNIRFSETPGASFQDLGFCIRTWLAAKKIAATHAAYYHYREDNPTASSRRKEDGAWAAYREIELLTDTFSQIPMDAATIRSCIVKRIFATLRADYRIRIQNTLKSFLLKYSHLLNDYFPLETLSREIFNKNEWYDLELMYHRPLLFPRKSRTRVNTLQRLFSCRTEAGRKILRIMGFSFELKKKRK